MKLNSKYISVKTYYIPDDGILFWDRERWKYNNPNGNMEDGYTELSNLLEYICDNYMLYDGYPIRDTLIVGMHDETGDKYAEIVEHYDYGFNSTNDWQEAQQKMWLDWIIPVSFGLNDDIWDGIGGVKR